MDDKDSLAYKSPSTAAGRRRGVRLVGWILLALTVVMVIVVSWIAPPSPPPINGPPLSAPLPTTAP